MAKLRLMTLIILFGCLGQIASDIYAPALPTVANSLATSINHAQFSMAIYLAGIALSVLIYGPISEGIGRRKPLLVGLIIMLLGSVICSFAHQISVLIVGRLLQGLGIGAGMVLWRSIFRDTFSGVEMAKYGSYLGIVITFIIPAAPIVGGYLTQYLGWTSIFVFLSLYTFITFIMAYFLLVETSKHHHPSRLTLTFIRGAYRELLTDRTFIGYGLAVFFTYGAFFAWFTISPVLIIHQLNISPALYGWINLIGGGFTVALANFTNGRLVSRFGIQTMLNIGWGLLIFAGVLMVLLHLIIGLKLLGIIIPMILFFFGVSLIWPNAFACAFTPFGHIAGYAGALYAFLQIGGGAVMGILVSFLPNNTQLTLALVFLGSGLGAWLIYQLMIRPSVTIDSSQSTA